VNIDTQTIKLYQMEQQIHSMLPWLIPVIIILAIWDSVWKLIAMWKAGRNNHLAWFICIALINTLGILPIIYIFIQRKNNSIQSEKP
jgi:sorbitol-specific phosphotransferase system component IIC